jgi:flagellar hook assembly protein FlgD
MSILKLYNYPNPFSRDTYFTFVLTGDSRPEELHIRIFTIAGRRVKEIVVPQSELAVGFNRVYWDGRDADGDELANGYYFYKVTIKGEGQTESSIEKLAKIR